MDLKTTLISAFILLFATGCVPGTVDAVFVSGHLGNYTDCPEEGYGSSSRSQSSGDVAAGACAEGTECTPIVNCEAAQITLRFVNTGDSAVEGLDVELLELVDARGQVHAQLPMTSATDTATGDDFDGSLEPGEEVDLRIDFEGPADPSAVGSDGAFIDVTYSADGQRPTTVQSDELYGLPSVVT